MLWATGAGLLIANPMMLIGNDVHARLRRLRDRTERQLQDFLEILEQLEDPGHAQIPRGSPIRAAGRAATVPLATSRALAPVLTMPRHPL